MRKVTTKEADFITTAMNSYYSSILTAIFGTDEFMLCKFNQEPLVIEDEVVVKMHINHENSDLLVNCYFSGKSEFIWNNKTAEIAATDALSINEALKTLEIIN